MSIKEHYITSFFFHAIVVIIAAAFSQTHLKAPNMLAVSLSADPTETSSATGLPQVQVKHELSKQIYEVPKEKIPAEVTEVSAEDKVMTEKEAVATPKPGGIPEAAIDISRPDLQQESALLAHMHHAYIMQGRAFMDNFSEALQKSLLKAIESTQAGSIPDDTAEITYYFDDKGDIGEVLGSSKSDVLKSVLNRLEWWSVPLPGEYRLRIKGLQVKVRMESGKPSLTLTVL